MSNVCRLVIMLALVKAIFLISLVIPGHEPAAEQEDVDFAPRTVVAENTATAASPAAPLTDSKAQNSAAAPVAETAMPAVPESEISSLNPHYPPMSRAADAEFAPAEENNLAYALARDDSLPLDASQPALTQPVDDTMLARASAGSTARLPRILGVSVAEAADVPALPDIVPPAPVFRNGPVADVPYVRPDEEPMPTAPVPAVAPFVSIDSAAQKQAEMNRREQELLALQQQMEARMGELSNMENRLQGMLQDANNAQDGKTRQLIDMYANMKPRVAAQALTTMDETIAVRILTGMKSKQAGEILSYMDPGAAARLSEIMSKMQM